MPTTTPPAVGPALNEAMPNKKPHSPQPTASVLCALWVCGFFWGRGPGACTGFSRAWAPCHTQGRGRLRAPGACAMRYAHERPARPRPRTSGSRLTLYPVSATGAAWKQRLLVAPKQLLLGAWCTQVAPPFLCWVALQHHAH
jgi:hypothetical protein